MQQITEGHRLYVVCLRNHAFYLVGPFDSYDAMRDWADYEEQHGDDPRWQSIELREAQLTPMPIGALHGPDWHPGYTP